MGKKQHRCERCSGRDRRQYGYRKTTEKAETKNSIHARTHGLQPNGEGCHVRQHPYIEVYTHTVNCDQTDSNELAFIRAPPLILRSTVSHLSNAQMFSLQAYGVKCVRHYIRYQVYID